MERLKIGLAFALSLALCFGSIACAAAEPPLPVVANEDHAALLSHPDPAVARNKRFVYDFWREVIEAGQLHLADRYLTEDYIQHNPRIPTGLQGFKEAFGAIVNPKPVADRVQAPLVAIVAERDLVVLSFVARRKHPRYPDKTYTTTWFDMFRIQDGKIAEHWDPALLPSE